MKIIDFGFVFQTGFLDSPKDLSLSVHNLAVKKLAVACLDFSYRMKEPDPATTVVITIIVFLYFQNLLVIIN